MAQLNVSWKVSGVSRLSV